jgi:hypothetical protein
MVFELEKSRLERIKIVGRHLNACRTDSLSEMAFAMELDGEEETGMPCPQYAMQRLLW